MERKLVADWMKENKVDQPGLAARTGVKQSHISEFLSGKKGLGWDNVVAICKETGIDMNALAGLKKTAKVELKIAPDGIHQESRFITLGRLKIRINGYIDAEIVNAE